MKHHFEARCDDEALDKALLAAAFHPLMSNAKWVKLIKTLVANWQLVQECKVKLIWENADVERWLRIEEEITYEFDYYTSAMEAMVVGTPPLGWVAYKEIEWLDFSKFSRNSGVQDLQAIQQKIEKVGQFQLDASPDNLRLYAYQRPLYLPSKVIG
jgi:hypothetical protein